MKKLAWIGIVILALVVLILGAAGVTKAVFGGRYQAEIAAIRAKGEPVTPAELMGNPIPPAENAALVYEQAFNELDDPAVEQQRKALANFDASTSDAAKWREAERALSKLHRVLVLTDQAASMPRCRFEIDWSDLVSCTCPGYPARMRSLTRLEYFHARISARNGNTAQAVDDTDTLFRMAKSMENEPLIINQLVRIALLSMATKALDETLRRGDIGEEQARSLFRAAGDIDIAKGFKRGWQGERVYMMHNFGPEGFVRLATLGGTGSVPTPVAEGLASLYARTVLCGDLAVYLDIVGRQVDGVGLSFREAKARGLFDEPVTPFYASLSKAGTTTVLGPYRYSTEEKLARTQVFLALQAYKARFGGYPASMGELKSRLGWKLPEDPFSGKDFIYKRKAKGFILYSVGPDMKDDGGRAVPNNKVSSINDKGDIVLKWNR